MPMTGAPAPQGRRAARTQAERRAASEKRLLRVTAELIAQRGTSSVGFGEIAKAAGCSHGLPSYLFGTKAGLLQALVNDFNVRFRNDVIAPAVGTATGLDALIAAARVFLRSLERPWPQTRAMYVLLGEASGSSSDLQEMLGNYDAAVRATIEQWIVEGIRGGDIRREVNPANHAVIVLGMLRGVAYQAISDPLAFNVDALTADVMQALGRMLAAPG